MTRYIMTLTVAAGVLLVATSAMAGLPDPGASTVPDLWVGAESEVSPNIVGPPPVTWESFLVTVRDINSAPVDLATVTIDFSTGSGDFGNATAANPSSVQDSSATADCPTQTITQMTNASGLAIFNGGFGGAENMATIEVRANGVLLKVIRVRSTDIDGIGETDSNDLNKFRENFFNNPGTSPETDYSDNGTTGSEDLNFFREAFFGATGVIPPCP